MILKCVVCGGLVVADEAKVMQSRYRGETFGLCCAECRANFEREPEAYLPQAWLVEHRPHPGQT